MYFVLSKSKENNLSVECTLKFFDCMPLPILLYGCKIWGYENIDIIESIHIDFMRHILPAKKSTPFYFMIDGELVFGRDSYLINKEHYNTYYTNSCSGTLI